MIKDAPKPLKILDAGGTENFWVQMGFTSPAEAQITILNINKIKTSYPNFNFIQGNAKDLNMFKASEFEIVFSNSVIEHVGAYNDQKKMADEIIRVGKAYFVQTPNYYFPIEPHFLFPFFQFLPEKIKILMAMNFNLGWFEKSRTKEDAVNIIDSVHLLKFNEFRELFPDAKIEKEKLAGFVKSFVAIKNMKPPV